MLMKPLCASTDNITNWYFEKDTMQVLKIICNIDKIQKYI